MNHYNEPEYYSMRNLLGSLRLDGPLLVGLLALMAVSAIVLYSASGQSDPILIRQVTRFGVGLVVMTVVAQVDVHRLYMLAPPAYLFALVLLVLVPIVGDTSKGAQRWLDLGFFSFQPSELMKLALPMMLAFYFSERRLPPDWRDLLVAVGLLVVPAVLIFMQPDLGTALLIATSGVLVIFFAGIRWYIIAGVLGFILACVPVFWHYVMHDYQRRRVETFLNPEADPLGAGYHIIQSKIALGAGGINGKGWLNGSQSQLQFLPERTTDFIFAVYGEEFGLYGVIILFLLYLFLVLRGLYIAWNAKGTFSRLLGGSLSVTFFVYFFVNVGMSSGLLPVVGVPLPMVSYGGTSMMTLLISFGILMAIQSERKLVAK